VIKKNLKDRLLDALLPNIEEIYTDEEIMHRRLGKSGMISNRIIYDVFQKISAGEIIKEVG
jgi:hypothetical protein